MLIVTTPAATTYLTTVAAVKTELGLTSNEHDAQLAGYISQASASVKSYCNRIFARESVSETFRLEQRQRGLILARFPVSAIDAIVENDETLAETDYDLDTDNGALWRVRSDSPADWPCGKIVVAYTAGYLLPGDENRDLPEDVERAAITLAVQSFNSAGVDATMKRESVDGIGSRERFPLSANGMTPEADALLARYRQVAI